MRKFLRSTIAAGVLAALLLPCAASAQSGDGEPVFRNAKLIRQLMRSRAARLQSSAGADPDTVYVGKSFSNHLAPDNYWNLYTGKYLPGTNDPENAFWGFDNTVGSQAPDSLQGWWPANRQYNATGGLTLTDDQRPWWTVDHGNIGNYVIAQQASAKRTIGVVGYWHSDPGKTAGKAVPWTPISGSRSAWCGLRQHADLSVMDAVTGQPYNQDCVQWLHDGTAGTAAGGFGSGNNFPGYPDQIDQMLYRDITTTSSQSLVVSFRYRTRMSTSIGTAAATRSGWFHGDPLAVVAGNFISSSAAGTLAPQDSFMVYVGAPVNDAACVYSDGITRPVYDKQRRWFSEVLKLFGPGNTYFEIFAATGNNPADTAGATPAPVSVTVPAAQIATILGAPSGNVRLVFRVKTNRGFADSDTRSSGYTSFGYGAVLLDDVSVDTGAGAQVIGDFEQLEQGGVNAVDNRFPLPPGLTATDVWRSTGKPPSQFMHLEHISGLTYNDLCGAWNSPARLCNIEGLVVTMGNHDDGERSADSRFTAYRDILERVISPTINLMPGPGGAANSQGISATIKNASDDYILMYDLYAGMFNLNFTGNTWVYGHQSYPAQQPNGAEIWGGVFYPGFILFNPEPQCFTDFEGMFDNGTPFRTSRGSGIPDSVRFVFAHLQQCFRFAVSLGCNSSEGGYYDNMTLAFVDLPGVPGQASASSAVSLGAVSSDIWQFVNDTFPANETAGLPGTAAFDTTTALIRTGLNNAQATGNALRFDIPGDSSSVIASNATTGVGDDVALRTIRVDLVFRILPGPGNYQIAAGRSCVPGGVPNGVLLRVPTNQAAIVAPGDGSFWGTLIADPGEVSAGTHNGHTSWDPLTWNSVRMDTTELNIQRTALAGTGLGGTTSNGWMTMVHEEDPRFLTLGVDKFKCFIVDTTKTATATATFNNVVCDGTVPAWLNVLPRNRTGWDGSATTKEFTKIIPDGLLTPGSHVQYFYRKSHAVNPLLNFSMCPDTNLITPQTREGSTDQHRWQQFSVLPDRWKASTFGGAGAACMLYLDLNDRRGNEGRFIGVMDSIGGTAAAKRGAHNGWSAPGNVDISVAANVPSVSVNKNAQPGTMFDMYGVKASESLTTSAGALGSRLANRANMGFAAGRESRQGPTPDMLRAYYRTVAILSGDLNSGVLGPFVNRSQNDIALLSDFLASAGGTPQPRGIFIQGDGFAQSEKQSGGVDPAHTSFLSDKLGLLYRSPSYISLSGNNAGCADLLTTTSLAPSLNVYGVANSCTWSNDVLQRNPGLPEAIEGAFYENAGLNGPYVADVVKPAVALRPWVAVTSPYEIEHLFSRYCDNTGGRIAYYYFVLNRAFGTMCNLSAVPLGVLEHPGTVRGGDVLDFLKLGNSVMRGAGTTVRLGIPSAQRVRVELFDVAGRRVRTLADRVFAAGEATLVWDGRDDAGAPVGRGVYFVRSSHQPESRKIVVLQQ